jgi:ribosome biogenesis protein UTP30
VLNASRALLKHMKKTQTEKADSSNKKNLLAADDDDEEGPADETPVWLTLTTKKHIIDQKRLKPSKIALPHPLNTTSTATICLITADPQRSYKDIVASPAFPAELRTRITRVIGVSKIKAKYHQYEAQRQLFAEHDMFLADDRILTQLPKALGKTFYKSTTKRPIPVDIQVPAPKTDGKRIARAKGDNATKEGISPQKLAAEIEKTLACALVSLSPSTNTSVRIGYAGWSAEHIAANVEAVTRDLIERFVPQKWRNVRGVHIKGPETAALPIWLADELWADEGDILPASVEDGMKPLAAVTENGEAANVGKKRKALLSAEVEVAEEKEEKKVKKSKKEVPESNDANLDKEIALRKEKLRKQKEEAVKAAGEDELPKSSKVKDTKKMKKGKAVAA